MAGESREARIFDEELRRLMQEAKANGHAVRFNSKIYEVKDVGLDFAYLTPLHDSNSGGFDDHEAPPTWERTKRTGIYRFSQINILYVDSSRTIVDTQFEVVN